MLRSMSSSRTPTVLSEAPSGGRPDGPGHHRLALGTTVRNPLSASETMSHATLRIAAGRSGLRANLALLTGSIAFSLVLGEVIARTFLPAPLPWRYPQLLYRADSALIFALRPDQSAFTADKPAQINARGFRGR